MLISEYLALRNQISVTTGNTVVQPANGTAKDAVQGGSFAEALQEKLNEKHGVEFSKHALQRLEEPFRKRDPRTPQQGRGVSGRKGQQ